ncbi:MAG: hypothetical protein WCL53_05755 [Chloroflexota bacterium]
MTTIDPDADFATYYKSGRDPDETCKRLYQWHQMLWGRTVHGVAPFQLEVAYRGRFELNLITADGKRFRLGSDGIVNTWTSPGWARRYAFGSDLVAEIAADTDDFYRIASTIGGYIVFPLNSPDQAGNTINQARGVHPLIADRFDLTLECIRRHYAERDSADLVRDEDNPLRDRLACYGDFFGLFADFDTYVRFFLLDDLLTPDRRAVRSLLSGNPLNSFAPPALAATPEQYAEFRRNSIAFVMGRNARIRQLGF